MAHYYDERPDAPSDRRIIEYRVDGTNFRFVTDSNVFSRREVDFGTDLMIREVIADVRRDARDGGAFLDLGCGFGVVGTVFKYKFMRYDCYGVDVNSRAVSLARENALGNNVEVDFVQSDVLDNLDNSVKFDVVATNPPVRAGKAVVFRFYEEAYERMNNGGALYAVLQRKQGAPSTEKKLLELFGNCVTLGIDGGYRVMKAVKEG
ncbi:16S rRNA (guanine1207-N2)-methyltransferase [Ruminococcaceae bacterium YRB3002]|nr:16S rRNA (guanine1207-N2)-methyltransferase [Ruminococcaceae bacterium YRB3002]